MKFRAIISDNTCMKDFANIVTTLSKLSKEVICRIEPEKLSLIGHESLSAGMPQTWSDIARQSMFSEYQMEGVDDIHPEIYLAINPAKLALALTMLRNNDINNLKFKLTNKQFPCLTVDYEMVSIGSAQTRKISHDVPVNLVPTRDWSDSNTPALPDFECKLTMPTLRSMRNLMGKIKNLAPTLTFFCNLEGELSLVVETNQATVSSHYRNLEVVVTRRSETPPDEISCRIDTKQLALCLQSNQFQNTRMLCNVSQDEVLKIFIEIRPNVSLSFCLWAVAI